MRYIKLLIILLFGCISAACSSDSTEGSEPAVISVPQRSFTVPAEGGEVEVVIEANCKFTVQMPADAGWIADITKYSSETDGGSVSLMFSVAANETSEQRVAVIKVIVPQHDEISLIIEQLPKEVFSEKDVRIEFERQSLIAIFESTGAGKWTHSDGWGSEEPVSQWYGISTDGDGFVSSISLAGNNLQGKIPEEFGNFASLTTLRLSDNNLRGAIPDTLWSSSSLTGVYLKNNNLSGLLPHRAASIDGLRNLDLTENKLRDGITPDFMNHRYFKSWKLQPQKSGYAVTEQWDDESAGRHGDGEVEVYQKATIGNGINIFVTCDGYSELNNSIGGTAERRMKMAVEALFDAEPYKSLRDYFNVYIVYAHSSFAGISVNGGLAYSKFATAQPNVKQTNMTADCDLVFSFIVKATGMISATSSLIILVANSSIYGGTCWMYSNGGAVGITPTSESFESVIRHECGGHGFAKLADEYFYAENGRVTEDIIISRRNAQLKYGWYQNADFVDEPEEVLWSEFLKDSRYDGTVGIYEGAFTYFYGAYRPSVTSIMRHNVGEFNAPSRAAIYKKIMSQAFDDWEYDYETFVRFDMPAESVSTAAAPSPVGMLLPEKELMPLGEPVVIDRAPVID